MRTGKLAAVAIGVVIGGVMLFFVIGLFQRLLITGSHMIDSLGDMELPEVTAEWGEVYTTVAPASTWPAGDDPSWSEQMPLTPAETAPPTMNHE